MFWGGQQGKGVASGFKTLARTNSIKTLQLSIVGMGEAEYLYLPIKKKKRGQEHI